MNTSGLEIERKFLIRYPKESFLAGAFSTTEIVQTYLSAPNGVSERVRKRWDAEQCKYYHTEKIHISDMTRIEKEREINEAEYLALLERADSERRPIEKKRCCINYQGQIFEIDVYPFYTDRAIMEIELASETQEVVFPPEAEIIREVTNDKRYTNASMAQKIPYDAI